MRRGGSCPGNPSKWMAFLFNTERCICTRIALRIRVWVLQIAAYRTQLKTCMKMACAVDRISVVDELGLVRGKIPIDRQEAPAWITD